ncbi:MAG: hypothetical protein VW521_08225 [Rhodospirillales bacterium]
MPKNMLKAGTESLEIKKMHCGTKRKGKMMGGYNMAAKKKKRMGKMKGGAIANAMPKGAPC